MGNYLSLHRSRIKQLDKIMLNSDHNDRMYYLNKLLNNSCERFCVDEAAVTGGATMIGYF